MDDLFDRLDAIGSEEAEPSRTEDPQEPERVETHSSLILARVQNTRPRYLDGGRTILRPSLPYDETCRVASCFLDLYIGAHYAPSPSVPGCICHATVIYGTVSLTAEGKTFQLLERDAIRFAADLPYHFENMSSGTGRLLLEYQYLHKPI